jgi:riboflavin synthase
LFTGLIEEIGRVVSTGSLLVLETGLASGLLPGESLAIDGSCLSVEKVSGKRVSFRVSPETLRRTVPFRAGAPVNLERPLRLDGRLHGHLVTGHVDCTGAVGAVRNQGEFSLVRISCPAEWHCLLVEKGSVAVSGISLTVADLVPGAGFTVTVIPETLTRTGAALWKPGTQVNLEFDIIGKYVQRGMECFGKQHGLRHKIEQG